VSLPLPDPSLVDGPVRLRPWAPDDAPALAAAWADPEVACWTGVPPVRDEAAARRWIEGDAARRAARLSLDLVVEVEGQVAGEVGLSGFAGAGDPAEIGWWTGPHHRRRGLATTAVRLLAAWAVGPLGLAGIEARCHPDNPASGAVAHAAGFTLDDAASTPQVRIWRFERGG
jgi:RimJ/RimL family protein N-acetyltransferase